MSSARAPFDLAAFLAAPRATPPDPALLEALARKVEVARRLHATYDADLRAPASPALLDPSLVGALGGLLLDEAARRGDLKLLNCALKLQGGVLLEPSFDGDPALQAGIDRLLAEPLPPCAP